MLVIQEHGEDERFTCFSSSERNTLYLQQNGSYIIMCCLNVGLALDCLVFSLSILSSVVAFIA
jgi:hypothetical protein